MNLDKNGPNALDRANQLYREAYRLHGNSPSAVLWPKGRQDLRFAALTRHIAKTEANFSVLDFGCGLGHLRDYLVTRFGSFSYHGVDLIAEFIGEASRRSDGSTFQHIESFRNVNGNYDHILLSGVFNLMYREHHAEQWEYLKESLEWLFAKSRRSLSVNFMTDEVDYQQPGAYHQNPEKFLAFARQKLSPRLVLDQSYMPYEFTVTIYKQRNIVRPDNVYEGG